MGFEKRNENVFCDRYRRHATFRCLCVFFFSRALTLQNENWAQSGLRRECFNAFRQLRIIFKSVQLTGTNFHFYFLGVASAFFAKNWGARRLALRLAEDLRVLEVHSRLELVSPFPLKKFCCCSRCCCFLYYASSVVSLLSLPMNISPSLMHVR